MKRILSFLLAAGLAGTALGGLAAHASYIDASSAVHGSELVLVDGDTVAYGHERIRLQGPDTPESWKPRCDAELAVALEAKAKLRELLGDNEIVVERHGVDRYSRTLALLHIESGPNAGQEVGELLIASGLAVRWQPGRAAWLQRARHWCPGFVEN